ncbi:MAG TPA: cytochrome P460 family protein [Arachidicoccus sp.]
MKYLHIITVIAIVMWSCSSSNLTPVDKLYNKIASVNTHDSLPENPLNWKIITFMLDRKQGTTATLYGNDIAVDYARHRTVKNYPLGARLALVTWKQQEDSNWFGARIPANILSVEMVTFDNSMPQYNLYQGQPLRLIANQSAQFRQALILSYRAAVTP